MKTLLKQTFPGSRCNLVIEPTGGGGGATLGGMIADDTDEWFYQLGDLARRLKFA